MIIEMFLGYIIHNYTRIQEDEFLYFTIMKKNFNQFLNKLVAMQYFIIEYKNNTI